MLLLPQLPKGCQRPKAGLGWEHRQRWCSHSCRRLAPRWAAIAGGRLGADDSAAALRLRPVRHPCRSLLLLLLRCLRALCALLLPRRLLLLLLLLLRFPPKPAALLLPPLGILGGWPLALLRGIPIRCCLPQLLLGGGARQARRTGRRCGAA